MNENISWLTTVSTSDCNFKSHLQTATVEKIKEALSIMTGKGERGNATRIVALSRELRKRERN